MATSSPEEDSEPPARAPVIRGGARPPEAAQGCGKTDEDDLGADPGDCSTIGSVWVQIEQPAEDDLTPEDELAYRIEILQGDQVFPTDVPIVPRFDRRGGPGVISSRISQARLRTKLRLIPVDAAGNAGPASDPIVIEFDETGRCALLSLRPLSSFLPTACILLWAITRRRWARR